MKRPNGQHDAETENPKRNPPTICLTFHQVSPIIPVMAKKIKRSTRVSEQIRAHLANSGLTRYRVAQATGIDEATLCRFAAGERGLSSKALDRLGQFLDLEVVMHGPTEKPTENE